MEDTESGILVKAEMVNGEEEIVRMPSGVEMNDC